MPLVQVVRGDVVEGTHRGAAVVLDAAGQVRWSVGDVTRPVLPRSCNKPMQVIACLRHGLERLDLPAELLALATASHSAEPVHVEGVRRILATVGLDLDALQTPAVRPMDTAAADAAVRDGRPEAPAFMDCSGKHAAFLATCVVAGWDTGTYLDPAHPLQVAVRGTFEAYVGEPVEASSVDGCGAPLPGCSLTGLARAYATLGSATPETDAAAASVAHAFRTHPLMTCGTTRDELALMQAVPRLIAKSGADACYAMALPGGGALALKIDDGGDRARTPAAVATLRASGALDDLAVALDDPTVRERVLQLGDAPVLGGGRPIGRLRPLV
ncbi:asparaginase [Nocardioidaceae bacterium]|nr:asparaginase [Nocardioidaceae bacterium]